MRILHVTTRMVDGGAPRNILFSIDWERRAGHEVHLAMGPEGIPAQLPPGTTLKVIPHLGRAIRPDHDIRAYAELTSYIRREHFDVVHTHYSKAGILGRLAARGRAGVVVHTIHMASFGDGYARPTSWVFRAAERACASFTDFFVAVGEDLKRLYLQAGVGREAQFTVIRSAMDIERFARVRELDDDQRQRLRTTFGVPTGIPIIAAAGLLEPRKRFGMIIEKLSPLLDSGEAMLVIAGAGPEEASLRSLAGRSRAGAVRFLGFVENLDELFAVASVVVHASRVEGVPQVVVQALAAGLPVVATDVEGMGEAYASAVTLVDRNGDGLGPACAQTLAARRSSPLNPSVLEPWTALAVEAQLRQFHQRLVAAVAEGHATVG
jgi:glycosyltransferase involved in cell wall biosynthesis